MKQKNIFTNRYLIPVLAIFACILWGTAFPFLKISYRELMIAKTDFFAKMLFASYRFLFASILLISWYRFINGKKSFKVKKEDLRYLFFIGIMQTTLQYFFFYNGLANTTGVKGSILNTLAIFLTVIISHFLYKNDKLNSRKVLGLIMGLLGVIIVNFSKGGVNFSFKMIGEGFIIMATITSTIASIMVKEISNRVEPLLISAYQMLMGSIVLFLFAITKVSPFSLAFTPKTLGILFYLSFVSAAGFGIWFSLIRYNPLGYITLYKFVTPVSGVLFSALLLEEEKITVNIFLALLLVSLGIVLINYRQKHLTRI